MPVVANVAPSRHMWGAWVYSCCLSYWNISYINIQVILETKTEVQPYLQIPEQLQCQRLANTVQ